MIPSKWAEYFAQQRKTWAEQNLGRKLRIMRQKPNARVVIGSQEMINFSSNDYLGLVSDMRIAEAAARAAGRFGWGAGASRLVTGTSSLHNELEVEIAKFRGTESALLFGSGYQANLGVISALAGPGDAIFSDTLNHASVVAGCRLSGAEVNVFEHRDYDQLERLIDANKARGRRLIVSDSLFSLEGTSADLDRLVKIAEKRDALLAIDDAHANGVLGKKGRGLPEVQGVAEKIDITIATLSKGFGSYGGFVACSREVRDYLINRSRPFAYTTALPVPLVAANIEALKIVATEGEALRAKLAGMVRTLRTKLAAADFQPLGEHHIVPIVIGEEDKALAFADALDSLGMLVYAMRWPSVPKGRAVLRISVSAAHSDDDIYRLINACKTARDRVNGKGTNRMTRRELRRPNEPEPPAAVAAAVAAVAGSADMAALLSQVADPQAVAETPPAEAPPTETPAETPAETPSAPPVPPAPASSGDAMFPGDTSGQGASSGDTFFAGGPPMQAPVASAGDTLLPEGNPNTKTRKKPTGPAPLPVPPADTTAPPEPPAVDNASTLVPELDAMTPSEAPENYKGKNKTQRKTRIHKKI
ncbi:MAG: aminotransferase class I/II-fold pyridoxal phosphate-dependent enzyme [Planctomycetes bacterium]|nr:aminotransferase class I/II-fold pyridoxal phosphate-dependent enzyme [Planctomycetota bacterium]